jgi:hypothetical protein
MATRARIGIELKNGSVLSVYHHWNGYPEWLGRILNTHYNTRALAAELIDGGDMSSCWTEDRWNYDESSFKVEEYGPQYYVRESDGECPPRLDVDLAEYLLHENGQEYHYLFRNGEWVCYNMHEFDDSKLPEVVEIPSAALAV